MPRVARQPRSARETARPVEIPFPHKGVHHAAPRSRQPANTCVGAMNVVGFAPLSDRYGGGKAPGTRRAVTDQATGDGSNRVLGMACKPEAVSSADAPAASDFMRPNFDDTIGGDWTPFPTATALGSYNTLVDEAVPNNATDYVHGRGGEGVDPATGDNREPLGASGINFRMTNYAGPPAGSTVTLRFTYRRKEPITAPGQFGSGSGVSVISITSSVVDEDTGTDESGGTDVAGQAHTLEVQVREAAGGYGTLRAAVVVSDAEPDVWLTQSLVLSAAQVASIGVWNNVCVCCIVEHPAGGPGGLGTTAAYDVTQIEIEIAPENNPPSDATSKILLLLKNRCYIADLFADTLTTPAAGAFPNAGATSLARDRPEAIYYRPTDRFYAVDGVAMQVINGNANPPTVQDWGPLATAGTMPDHMRLVCQWRLRVVVARQEGVTPNPAFYAMSRAGDPYDWDPAALPVAGGAFLGNNTADGGQPEDTITALIPWTADLLLFGGSRSINVMLGDPTAGGSFENVARNTGVLGARAWQIDEEGNLWFMGASGLYRMSPGAKPVSVSGRRLYRWLDRVDGAQTLIQLGYDAADKYVYILLTPKGPPLAANGHPADDYARHLIYDIANDRFDEVSPGAFWPRGFRWSTMGPWSVCQITGASDDDRRFLMGGNDGYVRRPFHGGKLDADGNLSPTGTERYGTADDMTRLGTGGEAISTIIRYAPLEFPLGARETTCVELQASGTDPNPPLNLPVGAVSWRWLVSDSPTDIGEKDPAEFSARGTWFADADRFGQQENTGLRVTGGCHQLVLSQTSDDTSWAIDRVVGYFKTGGRRK